MFLDTWLWHIDSSDWSFGHMKAYWHSATKNVEML